MLQRRGVAPRASAQKRDRALGLGNYVHLALKRTTPLLLDKCKQGYSHAVLVFAADGVFGVPGVALLPQNTKAWSARASYQPVTDAAECAAMLKQWELGRRQGLEVLVPYGLSLKCLNRIILFDREPFDLLVQYISKAHLEFEGGVVVEEDPVLAGVSLSPAVRDYLRACVEAGRAAPPPSLPFD